jgi:hypothetical protein
VPLNVVRRADLPVNIEAERDFLGISRKNKGGDMKSFKISPAVVVLAAAIGFTGLSGQVLAQSVVPVTTTAGVPAPGKWMRQAGMLEAVSEHTVSVLDDKIYIVGGFPLTRVSVNSMEIFDIKANKWTFGTPYPMTVNHAVQATVDGKIYVIGGQPTNSSVGLSPYIDNVFMFDPKANQWISRASMPTKRSAAVAMVVGKKIYVGGGRPPRGNDFAVYDTETDKWEVLPDMPSDRNHLAGGAVDGKLYFIGGRVVAGGPGKMWDVVEMYDPATKTWSKRAQMPRARGGIFGGVVKGCIHVFGGEGNDADPRGVFPDHDVYNPKTDRWTRLPDMMIPVHAVNGIGVVNDIIYIPGGAITQGGDSNGTVMQVYNPAISCL